MVCEALKKKKKWGFELARLQQYNKNILQMFEIFSLKPYFSIFV